MIQIKDNSSTLERQSSHQRVLSVAARTEQQHAFHQIRNVIFIQLKKSGVSNKFIWFKLTYFGEFLHF